MKYPYYVLILTVLLIFQSCAPKSNEYTQSAEALTQATACSNFREHLFNQVWSDQEKKLHSIPSEDYQALIIEREIKKGSESSDTESQTQQIYAQKLTELYQELRGLDRQSLARVEVGDRTEEPFDEVQKKLIQQLDEVQALAFSLNKSCEAPSIPVETPEASESIPSKVSLFAEFESRFPKQVAGAYKVASTLYQSCNLIEVEPLSARTPWMQGIRVVGTHPNGVGKKRIVNDAKLVNQTNPFLNKRRSPASGCKTVESKIDLTPLIYDYGGKPFASSELNAALDLFKNAGSGTEALGIDCSGFVFSSYATAGLKMLSVPLYARQVSGVNAKMMMEPEKNGLGCMAKVQMTSETSSLRSGDVLATSGHVVMVDQVGSDPFGVKKINQLSQCVAQNLPVSGFDFTIIQSSPSIGGIGVNRFVAKDYFAGSPSWGASLQEYAVAACKRRFGVPVSVQSSVSSITRHKGTPECRSNRVKLVNESCLQSCRS